MPSRKTLLHHRHDTGTPMYIAEDVAYHKLLFNISVLGGSAINNHNRELKVLYKTKDYTTVDPIGNPNYTNLCRYIHMQYGFYNYDSFQVDQRKLDFAKHVMYNVERFYTSTTQIDIDAPAICIRNNQKELRLLALDRPENEFIKVIEAFLNRRNVRSRVTGIDIYDSWNNELTHLDIASALDIAELCKNRK